MRLRTVAIMIVLLALLATTVALGIAGAMASRGGWFGGWSSLSLGVDRSYGRVGKPIEYSFPAPGPLQLHVAIDEGNVRIVSGGTQATVVLTPTGHAATEHGAELVMASIAPAVHFTDSVLTVTWHGGSDPRHWHTRGGKVDVLVRLPAVVTSTMRLETRLGDIHVAGVLGDVSAATAFGDVYLSGLTGPLRATTTAGDLWADDIAAPNASVELRTEFGNVRLNAVRAASIHATSSSGDVAADDTAAIGRGGFTAGTRFGDVRLVKTYGNPITASSDSGDVDVELDRLTGPVNATTKFGDVRVTLPAGAAADASLVSRFGSISGPFVGGTREDPEPGKPVTGRVGAGGPRVTLSTDSGDARLTVADAAH